MTEPITRSRVLSGMRPTGRLHLGNYMGALYNWVSLQHEYDSYFFIADIHALTTDYADPSRIQRNTVEVALDFLSAGLDPERCTIFVQSHVPQHAELHLLLSMITPLGWLERVPTYKDQQAQLRAKNLNTYGFLGYPLLQSADILLYQPDFVPVGEDQVSHVELTREVARRFNQFYGGASFRGSSAINEAPLTELLPEPKVLLTPAPKLPGLDGRKMSKSYGNFVCLSDEPAVILQKISGMSNGGQRQSQADPGDPERCPVGQTHAIFSPPSVQQLTWEGCRTATILCQNCKERCGLAVVDNLLPIRTRRSELEQNPEQVLSVLHDGATRARARAEETLSIVRNAMGIGSNLRNVLFPSLEQRASTLASGARSFDLSDHADWWGLPPLIRARHLRSYWMEHALSFEYTLKEEAGAMYVTAKGKRVLLTTSHENDVQPAVFPFRVKPRSFEVMVLLCWNARRQLQDLVIPQKEYVKAWTLLKKKAGKDKVDFSLHEKDGTYHLQLGDTQIDVTQYRSRYELLQ